MEIWDINLLNPLSGRKSLDLLKVKCRVLFVCSVNDVTEVQIINKLISADIIHKLHCIPDIELVLRRCLVSNCELDSGLIEVMIQGCFWPPEDSSRHLRTLQTSIFMVITYVHFLIKPANCSEAAVPELQVLNNGYPTSCMICWMEVR